MPIAEWLSVNTTLVWATEREIEETFLDMSYAATNQVLAWLVRRGEVLMEAGGRSAAARRGDWIFPGSQEGRQRIERGSVILSLRFLAEWPTGASLFDHREMLVFPAASHRKLTRAAEALGILVRRSADRSGLFLLNQGWADVRSYFAIRQAFENWLLAYVETMLRLGQTPRLMASADERVLRAARLLDHCPWRLPMGESELARAVGLSVSQLNRLFARELGISPKAYLERRRLQSAILLLQHHRRSVKETAYELGFHSLPHFSAWFRRQQGISPRAFQKGMS